MVRSASAFAEIVCIGKGPPDLFQRPAGLKISFNQKRLLSPGFSRLSEAC
jgi:hypothetical protein